jgi:hypothetical protein
VFVEVAWLRRVCAERLLNPGAGRCSRLSASSGGRDRSSLGGGCRYAVLALVEFLKRRLVVSENAVQLGAHHAVGTTKGRKGRSAPVPAFVLDELSMQCDGKAPGDRVFPGPDGGYLPRPRSTSGWFRDSSQAGKSTGDHSARPSPHLCLCGHQCRGERVGPAADARAHLGEGHAGHLRRPVRHRPRRGRGHPPRQVLARECGQNVATGNFRRRMAASKIASTSVNAGRAMAVGGGIRALFRYRCGSLNIHLQGERMVVRRDCRGLPRYCARTASSGL